MKIVVGTRGSKLALVQTNWVVDELKKANPGIEFEIKVIKTSEDDNFINGKEVKFLSEKKTKKKKVDE